MTNENQDAEGIKQELLAAWSAEHPAGTRQQFEVEWAAMTNEARPNDAPIPTSPARWDEGPAALKHKFFEEWKAGCPEGTMDQFEAAWAAVTG
jgi:hypothetical protein